ncbi:hypothetical protein GCM10007858_61730 [Bradyrhizobium liaoningense]|nr:hypothetical protein GCM10007858_61730 [Bradyrhizobium liaoningense]
MFDKCQCPGDKVVDAARDLAMGLASRFPVGNSHQAKAFIGVINAARDFDQFLGIHPKDVECECSLVRTIDVFHPTRGMDGFEKIAPSSRRFAHNYLPNWTRE